MSVPTFSLRVSLETVKDWCMRSGFFDDSSIGEPKAPKAAGFAAAVYVADFRVAELTLNNTVEVHTLEVRIYRNMLTQPEEDIEVDLADRMDGLKEYLAGNFKLDQTDKVRAIDFGGMFGAAVSGKFGYVTVSETMHRIATLTLPIIVDDSSELIP